MRDKIRKDKMQEKENNIQDSNRVNRRKALATLGTTGLAFMTGILRAEAASNNKWIEGARIYDNVSAMKSDKRLKKGEIAITLGYYTAGDKGGNTYQVIASDKDGRSDGGGLIETDNGLWAK